MTATTSVRRPLLALLVGALLALPVAGATAAQAHDVLQSTDGPVEHVHVRCVAKHRFVMPVASLARDLEGTSTTAPERELVRVRVDRADEGDRG